MEVEMVFTQAESVKPVADTKEHPDPGHDPQFRRKFLAIYRQVTVAATREHRQHIPRVPLAAGADCVLPHTSILDPPLVYFDNGKPQLVIG